MAGSNFVNYFWDGTLEVISKSHLRMLPQILKIRRIIFIDLKYCNQLLEVFDPYLA
jgi:hypothetical protein